LVITASRIDCGCCVDAGKPSVEALRKGLNDLVSIAEYTLGTFQSEFQMFVDSNGITEDGSEVSEMEE
jgi:hypothetical protein